MKLPTSIESLVVPQFPEIRPRNVLQVRAAAACDGTSSSEGDRYCITYTFSSSIHLTVGAGGFRVVATGNVGAEHSSTS